jgi:CubicO group peptidase (beta-lactamase class C family)
MLRQSLSAAAAPSPDEWAEAFFAAHDAPALSFAVAGSDGPLWSAAYGLANVELGVAARPEHRFRLGSVSKVITTTAAARLVTRGLIELDTPIAYWLPDLPEHHRRTTLRQLLTHTGGLRHYGPQDLDPTGPGGAIIQRHYADRQSILALFIDDPLVADPGQRVSYSSFGYTLASMVMEAATGLSFLDIVAEEIVLPFGLLSLAADDVRAIVPDRVAGYFTARELELFAERLPGLAPLTAKGGCVNIGLSNPAFCWAGAGLVSHMPDLARFGAALLDGPQAKVTAGERALLFTPLTEGVPEQPPLGLGWRIDADGRGRARYHHAGTTPGGRCALAVYPREGLSIALAGNTMTTPADALGAASELADLFA